MLYTLNWYNITSQQNWKKRKEIIMHMEFICYCAYFYYFREQEKPPPPIPVEDSTFSDVIRGLPLLYGCGVEMMWLGMMWKVCFWSKKWLRFYRHCILFWMELCNLSYHSNSTNKLPGALGEYFVFPKSSHDSL